MKKPSISKRLKYSFDNLMSKGVMSPMILLLIISTFAIILIALIVFYTGVIPDNSNILGLRNSKDIKFYDVLWLILVRTLDGGVIAQDPVNYIYVGYMLLATLGGIVIVSIFIGIVSTGVISKMDDLRKGRSFVVEKNHTVILGWSFQVFNIISELVVANENQKNAVIAILADKDKLEMEDEIRSKVGDTANTKVICRTGNPIDLRDLEIINPHQSKAIIITAPDSDEPDSNVIKTILAITNNPHRKVLPDKYHIVAEIRNPRNMAIAQIAGRDEVQLVVFDYLISRITAQTCRQPGLSVVFTELLDFKGDEIYFQPEPRLTGKTFVETLFAYENSAVIGLRRSDGRIYLKPPMNTIIEEGDILIAISEDDDTVILSGIKDYNIDSSAIRKSPKYIPPKPESTLILGWNRRAPLIINELDNYVWPGSKITVVADHPTAEKDLSIFCGEITHQTITFWQGDTTNRKILDELNVIDYDHIIVLSQAELTDVQSADARTLNTLLQIRDLADKQPHTFSIVSEMLDDRNRELAEITHTDDFIVSVKLDSLMLAQIAENKELKTVFELLFSAGGPAIYIKPAEYYVELGRPVNFYTIMESARQQNQIAIGYKLQKSKPRYEGPNLLAHGVSVNPVKSNQLFFSEGDKIIVLSDEVQIG